MKITLITGPEVEPALDLLGKLADTYPDRDLTKQECLVVLKKANLNFAYKEIKAMKKEEFEDFMANHVY